jgi:hypothetical protein
VWGKVLGRGYILVEGHGELGAVDNLVSRLSQEVGFLTPWAKASRWPNLHQRRGLEKGANLIRTKPDVEALLILRDEDDACPAQLAPVMSGSLRELRLPFPSAVVLLHPEYEVLFLPCLPHMAGKALGSGPAARPGLKPGVTWEGPWEAKRGIKEWLSIQFPANRIYKPTLDQLPLTRLIDFAVLRESGLPCFGSLERALRFLSEGHKTGTYPLLPK